MRLVHSTSWRWEGGAVTLSFIAVIATEGIGSMDAVPVVRADLARSSPTEAPHSIEYRQVLEHGLRHLAWLEHPTLARYWRAYEAFTKGDADTIRDMLADDLVWHVPGRHRFSGDRNKAKTMALFEEVVPEFSQTGEPVITTFNIEVEGIVATDEWVFTRVHWNHWRNGKRFDQHGMEVYRMNAEGQIAEFWALMRDTAAFDEFFA